jgi:hypothetical protein
MVKMKRMILTFLLLVSSYANAWTSELPFSKELKGDSNPLVEMYNNYLTDTTKRRTTKATRKIFNEMADEVTQGNHRLALWLEFMYKTYPDHVHSAEFTHGFYNALYDQLVRDYLINNNQESLDAIMKDSLSSDARRSLGAEIALLRIQLTQGLVKVD